MGIPCVYLMSWVDTVLCVWAELGLDNHGAWQMLKQWSKFVRQRSLVLEPKCHEVHGLNTYMCYKHLKTSKAGQTPKVNEKFAPRACRTLQTYMYIYQYIYIYTMYIYKEKEKVRGRFGRQVGRASFRLQFLWHMDLFRECTRGGRINSIKTELPKRKNRSLVQERSYRHSARVYLVDGSWDPQNMKPWGWKAALIRSKTKYKKVQQCIPRGLFLSNPPSSLGCYFWATYPFSVNTCQYLSIMCIEYVPTYYTILRTYLLYGSTYLPTIRYLQTELFWFMVRTTRTPRFQVTATSGNGDKNTAPQAKTRNQKKSSAAKLQHEGDSSKLGTRRSELYLPWVHSYTYVV